MIYLLDVIYLSQNKFLEYRRFIKEPDIIFIVLNIITTLRERFIFILSLAYKLLITKQAAFIHLWEQSMLLKSII